MKKKQEQNRGSFGHELDLQLEVVVENSEELKRKDRERQVINQRVLNTPKPSKPATKQTVWH